jgi:hypothetical protein
MEKGLGDDYNQSDFSSLTEIKHRGFCLSVRNLTAVPTELCGKTILMDDYLVISFDWSN